MKIGIIICARYRDCGGGKCFRSVRERKGGFARYAQSEPLEVVGYSNCGGCPGGNIEYVPEEMVKNGAQAIHLATGLVVGYPPCPNIRRFKSFIEERYGVPVVIGTHPIPKKYMDVHQRLSFWKETKMEEIVGGLMEESEVVKEDYN
ncbi:MAG: CGGC domain-containing protein [Candidatus Edwardsbacteria bacterium RIFOXYD12_FULL_50_11]|nr:MAG: CGGC domain-containing protein [Candidatus Edwardsbacteria bacterium RifOxyC12_full_54_24]OGF07052.1 MAG: CGGC domain-containing protein [Candidatus Edwardsbacteria bacterium RifOxyA12_full_54_48]OGF10983.1 MAG: CGGC domain-containing protein [Candidatus Edwardsbacteria bacterium GWE2_54_12]OGF15928.1 MAG: CGGC domain-containing protein [Candidatus Edwardsbacteria bacterium RIFOXYD12_FULL_50_11]OGJ17477.1 MAG: CGGC domain-containing protein [Candidatus Edwardsbacteria bacterium RifOxyB1